MKAYGDAMKNTRCPYIEAELDKEIRSVIWSTENKESSSQVSVTRSPFSVLRSPIKWAAAVLAAIVVPTVLFTGRVNSTDEVASVKVDGEQVYFACNNGCTADATIETFKTLLQ